MGISKQNSRYDRLNCLRNPRETLESQISTRFSILKLQSNSNVYHDTEKTVVLIGN